MSLTGDNTMEFGLELDINGYVSGMRKAADETGRLDAAQKKVAGTSGETASATEKAAQGVGKVGVEAAKGADGVNKFTTAAQSSGQRMAEYGEKMKQSGASLQDFGKKATAASLAVGAMAIGASKMANDYDREFSKITGLVGIAAEEVDGMKTATLGLAGSTAQAPQDLAKAMFTLQSAGLRGATATDALRVSAELAAGGMGEAGTIAQAMTSILATYASANVDAGQAADFLAATARAGNFESSQLAGGLGKVLPVASTLGIELSDVGGAIALLTRANGNASESITQVAAVMRVLLAPSGEAVNILSDVGLTIDDVKETAAGPGGLVAALEQLYSATGENDQQFAKMLGSSEAVGAAFQILGADNQTLVDTFGAVAESAGVAAEVFDAAANTDSFKTQQAFTELKVEMIELGEKVAPTLAAALGGVADVLSGVVDFAAGLPQPLKDIAGGVAVVTAVAGPALLAVGKLQSAVGALAAASAANGGLAGGLKALTGVTPAMLGVAGAAALGVAAFVEWRREAQAAEERADVYASAVFDAAGSNELFTEALERANSKIDEQADVLDGATDALEEISKQAQGFFDVMDGLGQGDVLDDFERLGVSLEDLAAISLGEGTADQLGRAASAMQALKDAGVDIDWLEFGKGLDGAGQAAADAAAETERVAVAMRTSAYESDLFTAAQFRIEKANAEAAGSMTPVMDAVTALTAQYLLLNPAIEGVDYAITGAEAAFLGMAGPAQAAAGVIGEVSVEAEESGQPLSSLEEALIGVSTEYREVYNAATIATQAVSDYRAIVDGTLNPQRALDSAISASTRVLDGFRTSTDHTEESLRANALTLQDQIWAMLGAGEATGDVTAKQAEFEQSLRDTAHQAGLSEAAIERLVRDYLDVPEDIVTQVAAETGSAEADLAALTAKRRLAEINAWADDDEAGLDLDYTARSRVSTIAAVVESADAEAEINRLLGLASIAVVPGGGSSGGSGGGGSAPAPRPRVINGDGVDITDLYDLPPGVSHVGSVIGDPGPTWSGERPMEHDERLILAQTGQRLLSRQENARFENGFGQQFQVQQSQASGPQIMVSAGAVTIDARGSTLTAGEVRQMVAEGNRHLMTGLSRQLDRL